MAQQTYTVVKGDNLTKIAKKFGTTVDSLVALNHIKNRDLIYIGQVLVISGDPSPSPTPASANSNMVTIKAFGLQADTSNSIFVIWDWGKDHTANYEIKWTYTTANTGVTFSGTKTTVDKDTRDNVYSAPSNATTVSVTIKPISETYQVESGGNKTDVNYWTAEWSTTKTYNMSDVTPSTPSVPSVELEDLKLTATIENINPETVHAEYVLFDVVQNNTMLAVASAKVKIAFNSASYSYTCAPGNEYKVRAACWRSKDTFSSWSDYSSVVKTQPATPSKITSLKGLTKTSVEIEWSVSATASEYEIEYTTESRYFDTSSEVQSVTVDATKVHNAIITGLETGKEYFFRVRAKNQNGDSGWTPVKSVILGKVPAAPTTWSLTTTAIVGENVILYWVHNSQDGSSQVAAQLETTINGVKETKVITNSTDEDEKDKTSTYAISTSGMTEGSTILWRVRTRGVLADYGDWSVMRTVNVYARPSISLSLLNVTSGIVRSFPFVVKGIASPSTQQPLGYYVTVTADEAYETVDNIGNRKMVSVNDQVFSNFYNTGNDLYLEFHPGNIDLENNIPYTIHVSAAMNSGLVAEGTIQFTVGWEETIYNPNAEIGYTRENTSAIIRPYCIDDDGSLVSGITLGVYRREYDGTFTEIMKGIKNTGSASITDPHPSLDFARYRIVATETATGAISYYDVPGYPVGEPGIIVQWDEDWSDFDYDGEPVETPNYTGSLLRLPYNVDVSDNHNSDVSYVEFIGRDHPVSYYGTQRGIKSTWSTEIPKTDKETLYALRRLAIWMGDVYVRESSGSGYWANVEVSFSQTHCEVTIPVTLNITRVEGGV